MEDLRLLCEGGWTITAVFPCICLRGSGSILELLDPLAQAMGRLQRPFWRSQERLFPRDIHVVPVSNNIFLFGVAMQCLTNVAAQSGKSLHAILLRTLLAVPFAVITSMDSGQIVNKFSQDIQLIDSELPMALMNFILCVATGIGQGTVILIVSPWTGLAFPPLLVLLYGIQKLYLKTSKQIRILDLEAKSPL